MRLLIILWQDTVRSTFEIKWRHDFYFYQLRCWKSTKPPAGTAGIERNHNIANIVLSQRRWRMNEESHHRQVAVAHIPTQLKGRLPAERAGDFGHKLNLLCSSQNNEAMSLKLASDDDDIHETDEGMLWLEAMVRHIDHRNEISQKPYFLWFFWNIIHGRDWILFKICTRFLNTIESSLFKIWVV